MERESRFLTESGDSQVAVPFEAADSLAATSRFRQSVAMKTLFFFLLTLPGILLAQAGLPTQPYIYVEGKAEVEKPADMVTLRFEVVARAPDEQKANTTVQKRRTTSSSSRKRQKFQMTT